jgi:hypothetical protein
MPMLKRLEHDFVELFEKLQKYVGNEKRTLSEQLAAIMLLGEVSGTAERLATEELAHKIIQQHLGLTPEQMEKLRKKRCGACPACKREEATGSREEKPVKLYRFENNVSQDKDDYFLGTAAGWGNFIAELRGKMEGKDGSPIDRLATWDIDREKTELKWTVTINGVDVNLIMPMRRFQEWERQFDEHLKVKNVSVS